MKPLQSARGKLLAAHRRGGRLALLFDYDGTLAPLVEHPRLASLDPTTRRVLERLAGWPGVHVGILSGRTIQDLKEMVDLSGLCFAGTGGLELEIHGTYLTHPDAPEAEQRVARIAERVQPLLAAFPGAWLEDKRLGFTLHYRDLAADRVGQFQARARAALEPFSGDLRCVDGPRAIEVTSELGWTKGTAVRLIARHLGIEGPGVLYAGDAANDAEALQTVVVMGGVAVGVGPHAPQVAPYRLPDAAALVEFLCDLRRSGAGTEALRGVSRMPPQGT